VCMVGAVVVGCVSIAPGESPGQPSLAIPTAITTIAPISQTEPPATLAPTPTPVPESTPTGQPTAEPTSEPTGQATEPPVPTAEPSPSGVDNYGAHTPVFDDQMEDPDSGWGTGANDGGSVAYEDGNLEIVAAAGGAWEWTSRLTGSTDNAAHFEGIYTPSGSGYMGLLCGDSEDVLWGGMANLETGEYAFIKLDAEGASVLQEGTLEALQIEPGEISRFALDCAGTATGSFRMQIYPAGTNSGAHYDGAPGEGPAAIDRVAIYAQSIDEAYSLTVDYLIAFGGDGDTSPTPEETELMSHVPATWQPDCFAAFADVHAVGATADVLCQLFDGRSDYADYISFDSKANMDAYFQYLVDKYAVAESGQNCDTGAHQGGYTIGGEPAGQLLCAPDPLGGTRLFWTHDDLLILSDLDDNEGSYPDMYADWLIAGPD